MSTHPTKQSTGRPRRSARGDAAPVPTEQERHVASLAERAREKEKALQQDQREREAKEQADAARGMPAEFPAEVAVAQSELEKCYREQRDPDGRLGRDIATLAATAMLTLVNRPDLPQHYRKVYEAAEALHDDYELFLAARSLRAARPRGTESEYTAKVLRVLTHRYWNRADVYPLLGRAVEALRMFGGSAETRTPRQAITDACGKPPSTSRKSFGVSIRRISELPENTSERQLLERCIGELNDADARKYVEYVYLGRGPSGYSKGTADLEQEGWTKGRRMDEAKARADAALVACFPELAKLKA